MTTQESFNPTSLKQGDILRINNSEFQVLKHTSLWFHSDRGELEIVVEMVKTGSGRLTSNFRLTYVQGRPQTLKYQEADPVTGEWHEKPILAVRLCK